MNFNLFSERRASKINFNSTINNNVLYSQEIKN